MRIARPCLLSLIALLLYGTSALAHRPLVIGGSYPDAAHALQIEEVEVSQVVYSELIGPSAQLWLTFEVQQGEQLYLSLGVPVIERLRSFRPALALLGPGLPKVDLPFAVPAGCGALLFGTADLPDPQVFHEPITDTGSWILIEQQVPLPQAGRYHLVAYSPSNAAGKLWVAVGQREAFGLADTLRLPTVIAQVRHFHEVTGGPAWLKTVALVAGLVLILIVLLVRR